MSDEPQPDPAAARTNVVLLAIAVEGGLIALALVVGWAIDQAPLSRFRIDAEGALWGAAATLPLVLLFLAMTRWPVGPLRSIKQFTEEMMVPLLEPCSVIDLLGISCLAGLGEEMLFRGVVQDALGQHVPPWAAVLLAGAVFGALHAVTPSYAFFAALMGAYLGALYLLSGNLLAPVVTHALYDFFALVYLLRVATRPSGEPPEAK
ncbi:MAG: CPBP family intramembrane glutamic endopeptidase [Gemmataceae bacterium]